MSTPSQRRVQQAKSQAFSLMGDMNNLYKRKRELEEELAEVNRQLREKKDEQLGMPANPILLSDKPVHQRVRKLRKVGQVAETYPKWTSKKKQRKNLSSEDEEDPITYFFENECQESRKEEKDHFSEEILSDSEDTKTIPLPKEGIEPSTPLELPATLDSDWEEFSSPIYISSGEEI